MPIIRLDPESPMGRQLQQLQTIFYAVVALPLLLFLMMYLDASQPGYVAYLSLGNAWMVHLVVWLVVIFFTAWAVVQYRKKNKGDADGATLETKFAAYVRHSRILYLVLGFLMLLPVGAIWATGLIFYSLLFLMQLILIASVRPTVEHFIASFKLPKEEQAQLTNRT